MKIMLLANNWVGLQICSYLVAKKENVIALGIHEKEKQKYTDEIIQKVQLSRSRIFLAHTLRDPKTVEKISKLAPDVIIAAFWGYILKEDIITIPPLGCINFHPGFLPYNRGMNPNVWPFVENTPAGVTLHYIDPGIDTGKIIAQTKIPITLTDTAGSLETKTWKEIVRLFKLTWPRIKAHKIQPFVQGKKHTFHLSKHVDSLDKIDLEKRYKARDLINVLRARSYKNKSFAYFEKDGKKISVNIKLSEIQ